MVENRPNQENVPGILLLGGTGSRLRPLTDAMNKQLLPIYDKPLALYSLDFLEKSGIRKIVVVANPKDVDLFAKLFDVNKRSETEISYAVQDAPLGTANAIKLAEKYITEESFFSLWGDSVFEFNLEASVGEKLNGLSRLHLTKVDNPQNFGVVEIDALGKILSIEDKPKKPKSNIICTGFMGFKSEVFGMIDKIESNSKGEFDIMNAIREVHSQNMLEYSFIKGTWLDAGVSFDMLLAASLLAKTKGLNKVLMT